MKVYVYVSDATEQTVITMTNHGEHWEQSDGEVYDLLVETEFEGNVIVIDGRPSSGAVCTEYEFKKMGERN